MTHFTVTKLADGIGQSASFNWSIHLKVQNTKNRDLCLRRTCEIGQDTHYCAERLVTISRIPINPPDQTQTLDDFFRAFASLVS